jgi:hypothetical protein
MPVRKHMQRVAAQGVRASTPADIAKVGFLDSGKIPMLYGGVMALAASS